MTVQWQPDDRAHRYVHLWTARKEGWPDQEVADKWKMSKTALYRQLANDGFPVCPDCGALHPDDEHLRGHASKKPRRRRPRGDGAAGRKLPPAVRAEPLFTAVLEDLKRAVGELEFLNEWFAGGRFVTEAVYPEESRRYTRLFSRKDLEKSELDPAAAWEAACKEHGYDPRVDEFRVPFRHAIPGGASEHPHDLLVRLIAAYALSGHSPEPLMDLLHPGFGEGNIEAFADKQKQLLLKARQLAAFTRGDASAFRPGHPREPVSPDQQKASWYRDKPDDHLPPWLRERGRGENDIGSLRLPRAEEPGSE